MTHVEGVVHDTSIVSNCSPYDVPSVQEYFKATNTYGIVLVCVGAVAWLLTLFIFVDTLRYTIRNASSRIKAYTAFVIAVYPMIGLVHYIAILVPRSYLLSEAFSQGIFMVAMYQMFRLFVSYCGGDAQLVTKVRAHRLSLNVGPCCCWPCCSLLPTFTVNKKTVKYLKLLVLQLPLVQGLVYLIILVTWAEDERLYEITYLYLQPIIIVSILFGIWGILMTIKLLYNELASEYLILKKFGALQMVLIFAKAQGIGTKVLVWNDLLPCHPPLTPQTYANLIQNTLIILEMVLLGFIARSLYKREIPVSMHTRSKQNSIISTVFSDSQEKRNNNYDTDGINNLGYNL